MKFDRSRITSSPIKERYSKIEIEAAAEEAERGTVPPALAEKAEKIAG